MLKDSWLLYHCALFALIIIIMSLTTLNNSHQNAIVQSFVNCYIIRLSGLSRAMIQCKLLNRQRSIHAGTRAHLLYYVNYFPDSCSTGWSLESDDDVIKSQKMHTTCLVKHCEYQVGELQTVLLRQQQTNTEWSIFDYVQLSISQLYSFYHSFILTDNFLSRALSKNCCSGAIHLLPI